MKRILQVIKGLDRGGAERLLVDMLRYRDAAAFDYEVAYLLRGSDAMVPSIEELDVPVRCLDAGRGPGWMRRLKTLVSEHSIDLVHVHSPFAAIGARLSLRGSEPRMVYTEHSAWEGYRPATRWGNLVTYPRNDHVFAVSGHVSESVRYPWSLSHRRMPMVETLHHGIDRIEVIRQAFLRDGVRDELGISSDAPVVGCVANFTPQKAHSVLLEAMLMVRDSVPTVRLVLVGGGPHENAVRSKAHHLGLDSTVVFTGVRSDAPRIATCFDVFVLSSVIEGLSMALIEAMALGKPAVVTDAGGLPEAIPAGGGLIVPAGDARMLAEGVTRLLEDPALRIAMGEIARHRAADFDVRKTVERIEAVYSELLA